MDPGCAIGPLGGWRQGWAGGACCHKCLSLACRTLSRPILCISTYTQSSGGGTRKEEILGEPYYDQFVCLLSCIYYLSTCGPKGYGSGGGLF